MNEKTVGSAQAPETIVAEALARIKELQDRVDVLRYEVSQMADRLLGSVPEGDTDKDQRGLSTDVGLANNLNGNLQILSDQIVDCHAEIERLKAL